MRKKSLLFIIAALAALIIASVSAFADTPVYVYINNKSVAFTDPQPCIENSRVMVPFRIVAEALGAEIDWNSKTEVLTLTKGTRVVVHKMRSNIITVDGTPITFDTPSINKNNRILMPVRMLAESLGNNVEWEDSTRSVFITTAEASVNSAAPDQTLIKSGSSSVITINATEGTEKVKAVNTSTGETIGEAVTYTSAADNSRNFIITWTPSFTSDTPVIVKIFAGDSSVYNEDEESTKTFITTVTANAQPKINSCGASDYTVDRNESVKVTVYANNQTERVKISGNFTGNISEITTYTESGDQRIFEGQIKMTKEGECELYIYPGSNEGYITDYRTLSIDVGDKYNYDDDDDDDDDDDNDYDIIDIKILNSTVSVKEDATVTVYTGTGVESVELLDGDKDRVAKMNFPTSKDSDELTWKFTFQVESSGRNKYTIKAYDDDDETCDSDTFAITGESYSTSGLYIISITPSETNVSSGDTVRCTVKTTSSAEYITVKDSGGNEVAKVTESSSSGSYIKFVFSIDVGKKNNDFIVYAYDSEGTAVSRDFSLDVLVTEDPSIEKYEIEERTVEKGDDIEIKVYTNQVVTKVWIEDEDEDKVQTKKYYDDSTSKYYIWEFSFEAETKGTIVYTIYAEDDDDNTDEAEFTIKVTK